MPKKLIERSTSEEISLNVVGDQILTSKVDPHDVSVNKEGRQ